MTHNIYEKDTYGWWCARIKDPKWRKKAFENCAHKLNNYNSSVASGTDKNKYATIASMLGIIGRDAVLGEYKTRYSNKVYPLFYLPKPYYEMESLLIGKQYAGNVKTFYSHFSNKWLTGTSFTKDYNWRVIEEWEIDGKECVRLKGKLIDDTSILKSDFFSSNEIKEEQSIEIPEWFNDFKEGDKFYNENGFSKNIKSKRINGANWIECSFINPACKIKDVNTTYENQEGVTIACGSIKYFVPYSELHKFKLHNDCLKGKNINKQPIITSKNNNNYETTSKAVKVSPITPTISRGQEITGTPVCGRKSKVAVASANLSYSAVSC